MSADLAIARVAEESKLAAKLLKPAPAVVEAFSLRLANSGLPGHSSSILAARIIQLEQHVEVLNGVCQSQASICLGLQNRIAALELEKKKR